MLTTLDSGHRYIRYLPLIVERYNESPHRGLFNKSPKYLYVDGKKLSEFRLLKSMLNRLKPTRNLLRVGDRVRLLRIKITFLKNPVYNVGCMPNFK